MKFSLPLPQKIVSREVSENFAALLASLLVSNIFSFVFTIALIRLLGVASFGLIILTIACGDILMAFLSFSSQESLVKFGAAHMVKGDTQKLKGLFYFCYLLDFFVYFSCTLVLYVAGKTIAHAVFHQDALSAMIRFYAPAYILSFSIPTSTSILHLHNQFKTTALLGIVGEFLKSIFPIFFIRFGAAGVCAGISMGYALYSLLMLAAVYSQIFKKKLRGVKPSFTASDRKQVILFSLKNSLTQSTRSLNRYLDVLILGYFRPSSEVGFYKIATAYAGLLSLFSQPLSSILFPALSTHWGRKDRAKFFFMLTKTAALTVCIATPLTLLLYSLSPYLIPFLFKIQSPGIQKSIWLFLLTSFINNTFSP